jgi:hypothetical protein
MAALQKTLLSAAASLVHVVRHDKDARDKWIGVYIGVLAVLLALCGMGGGNAAKDATRAKNIRRDAIRRTVDDLEMQLLANPNMPAVAKVAYEKKITEHKAHILTLTSDPVKGEGLDEIFVKAKGIETERDIAMRKDPYFDWGQALLQIGIVLASVCLITGSVPLLIMSAASGALGTLAMLNGFTLLLKIPGIG